MDNDIELRQVALVGGTILLALLGIYLGSRPKAEYELPPGPRGLPILGNALQLPNQVSSQRLITYACKALMCSLAYWIVLPLST